MSFLIIIFKFYLLCMTQNIIRSFNIDYYSYVMKCMQTTSICFAFLVICRLDFYIYIHAHIYIYSFFLSVVFESTLLNFANPCQNWTFQRFARVAEEKTTQQNK